MTFISSPTNPRIQRARALVERKKARDEEGAFVVEGVRLVEEAFLARWQADLVLYTSQLSERGMEIVKGYEQSGAEAHEIAPRLMEQVAGTESPQGLLAVIRKPAPALPESLDFVLIAGGLRDPGNLGTLLRTAAAAGAQAALLAPGTTDVFAPKVLRAGMGAHFRLPALHLDWDEIRALRDRHGLTVFLAEAAEGSTCWDLDLTIPLALVVGGEAEGSSPEARALASRAITIPMPGRSESLNAAIAASILLFEVVRQRRSVTT